MDWRRGWPARGEGLRMRGLYPLQVSRTEVGEREASQEAVRWDGGRGEK